MRSIIVLGMHRSGTSVVTKLTELMGAYVGETDHLLPHSPDNPKGFFERKDVLAVNQAIFKHHRCNWYTVGNYDEPVAPLPEVVINEMQRITATLSQHPVWALKDPRLCFTLPYWLHYIENPTIITVSRHPSEIAQSLMLRNDFPFEQGYALWQAYISHALKHCAGSKVVKCDYADLITDPIGTSGKLFQQLQLHIPSLTSPNVSEITQFISPSLRRAVHRTDINPAQQALFDQWRL